MAFAGAGWLVYAVCKEDVAYETVSKAAVEKGILARQLYLERGGADGPGLADRLADVVFVDSLGASDMTPERKARWTRALSPWRGVLVAGGPGIEAAALRQWLGTDARVVEAEGRAYAILRRPPDAGADQWRHRHHGADNRRVSHDQLFRPDVMTQWYSLPLEEGFWGTSVVAAGGRSYTLVASRRPNDQVDLVARSLHNGRVLWRRSYGWDQARDGLSAGVYGGRSILVAADDGLWIADGADILLLDGETGKETRRVAGPLPGGQIKWLVLLDGERVAALAGEADNYRKLTFQAFVKNPEGSRLAVYSVAGEKVWEHACAGPVDEREIAVHDNRVYMQCRGVATLALDARDGKELWRNTANVADIDAPKDGNLNQLLVSDRVLMADEHALIFGASWKKNLVALDPKDGKLLWQQPIGKTSRSLAAVLRDGKWYGWSILDARTGKKVGQSGKIPQSICSVSSSVGKWILTAFADVYEIEDLGKQIRFTDMRAPCDIGNIVADGVLLGSAIQCTCSVDIRGYRAAGPPDVALHSAGPAADRRTRFHSRLPASLVVTENDWPTHRHDAARSGATPVKIGGKPVQKWLTGAQADVPVPTGYFNRILPSPAVTADGLAFLVDTQGVLKAVEIATGKELWSQVLGARSFAPPAVDDGRVFVGDMAGYVHAFAARDGSPLWRFRAAPLERRVLWYGQLHSTWPCTGGVVLRDGSLYVVAGYHESNGMHAYALDPQTGETRWESHDAGTGGEWGPKAAFGLFGHLAVGGGRLWLAGSTFYPGSYSLKDGSWQAAPSDLDHHFYGLLMRRGVDVLVMEDQYVMVGGIRMANLLEPEEKLMKADGYNALSVRAPEVPKQSKDKSLYGVDMLNASNVTPAWDKELFVGARGKEGRPQAWSTAKLSAELQAQYDKGVDEADRGRFQIRSLNSTGKPQPSHPSDPVWEPVNLYGQEQVLAADCLLVVHSRLAKEPGRFGDMPERTGWWLSALERADGVERWRIDLPSKPLRGGLCVDRNGNVLIVYDNGSMSCHGQP